MLPTARATMAETSTPAHTTVSVTGDLDMTVADRLWRHLSTALASTPPALIIDLGAVSFCSASILEILVEITTAARVADVACVIVSDRRAVRRPITIAGLDPVLRPLPSLAAAHARLATSD